MSIYITTDTHGGLHEKKSHSKHFPNYKKCNKGDYVIITGDWGYIFEDNPTDIETDNTFSQVTHPGQRNKLIKERNKLI